jgi:hypothetical protein
MAARPLKRFWFYMVEPKDIILQVMSRFGQSFHYSVDVFCFAWLRSKEAGYWA